MFNTFEEIKKNKYINTFGKSAAKFGLYGVYYNCSKGKELGIDGVYFVFGSDEAKVKAVCNDLYSFIDKCKKEEQLFRLDANCIRLTDCCPFATHQRVVQAFRDIEFVLKIFDAYNRPTPQFIDYTSLLYLKTLYKNAIDKSISSKSSAMYNLALREYIPKVEEKIEKLDPRFAKDKKTIKSMVRGGSNRLTLEELFEKEGAIIKHKFSADMLPAFVEEMKKHWYINYYCAKVNKVIFHAPEKGFGEKKSDNDLSTVEIAYNPKYKHEISLILCKIAYPDAFGFSVKDINDESLCYLGIGEEEFKRFLNLCRENNIPFAISDIQNTYGDDTDLICIAYFENDKGRVDAILTALARNSELYHVFSEDTSLRKDYSVALREKSELEKQLDAQGIDLCFPGWDYIK